jgi:hypothetical protein
VFSVWVRSTISGAESYLESVLAKTTSPLFKGAIEHVQWALDIVAHGPSPELGDISADEQQQLEATVKLVREALADARFKGSSTEAGIPDPATIRSCLTQP